MEKTLVQRLKESNTKKKLTSRTIESSIIGTLMMGMLDIAGVDVEPEHILGYASAWYAVRFIGSPLLRHTVSYVAHRVKNHYGKIHS